VTAARRRGASSDVSSSIGARKKEKKKNREDYPGCTSVVNVSPISYALAAREEEAPFHFTFSLLRRKRRQESNYVGQPQECGPRGPTSLFNLSLSSHRYAGKSRATSAEPRIRSLPPLNQLPSSPSSPFPSLLFRSAI
jgi:hypothetical protein